MKRLQQKSPPCQTAEFRRVDGKCRVVLPQEFANANVTIEVLGESELRIRKAVLLPEDSLPFLEDRLEPLSQRDRDLFLELMDHPPEPTPAFRAAAAKHKKRHAR